MIKRILGTVILIPIAIIFSFWAVNFVTGVIAGTINLTAWILSNKVVIGLILAYLVFRYLNPFKKA